MINNFGVLGWFDGLLRARLRYTDKALAERVVLHCRNRQLGCKVTHYPNCVILEVSTTNKEDMQNIKKFTVKRDIARLETTLTQLRNGLWK